MRKAVKSILAGFAAAMMATGSMAAGEQVELEKVDWEWEGVFGTYDRAAMQRGFQVYREVCASCHALEHLAYRHLGEPGGPYYDEAYESANDNPIIKAFAADGVITDGPDDEGDMFERAGIPADMFAKPYPNEQAAAAANGKAPPDLSLMVSARPGGANYLYSILVGYVDAPEGYTIEPGLHYNEYFPGHKISMAAPLIDGIVTYEGEDAPEATVEQMAEDVTHFLAWAADPKMEQRKRVGIATMIYLFIFAILLYLTYRRVWKDVEH